jgi:hypothetical protein
MLQASLARGFARLIPAITPRQFAVFRLMIGLALLGLLLFYEPIRAVSREQQYAYSRAAAAEWIRALAADEDRMATLQMAACASAVLFAVGILARPAYTLLTVILTLHVLTVLLRRGWVHDWILPMTTLWALLVVPWGHAPSLFRVRSAPDTQPGSRVLGFAIWLPGLTIGLAFAAAAFAKLDRSGLAWITNGSVRYHFVEDGANAATTLGLWLATQSRAAVVLSLAAFVVEALFILVVFARSWRARAAFGLAGAMLMLGFFLFQGVAWAPWWMLFAAFLPWNRQPTPDSGRDIAWLNALVVVFLIASQVWASARRLEIEPFLSNYPMYSHTYDSTADFDRNHRRLRFYAGGRDITNQVGQADGEDVLAAAAARTDISVSDLERLGDFSRRYARLIGDSPSEIDVVMEPLFDWQHGRFSNPRPVGTVRVP